MGAGDEVWPEDDSWAVSIYAAGNGGEPDGSGIVLDRQRILTCYHVVKKMQETWIAFPKARDGTMLRRKAKSVILPDGHGAERDMAILVLDEAEHVPDSVTAAPLGFAEPASLVRKGWWAFGYPISLGSPASGSVTDTRGYGWIRLNRHALDPVVRGFSGAGLWCPEYQRVVGIVGQADGEPGGGLAMTLYHLDQWFPGQDLASLARPFPPAAADDALPVAPEVVELTGRLNDVPGALSIIREVFERVLKEVPPRAAIIELLTELNEGMSLPGDKPLLQQVSDLAEQRIAEGAEREAEQARAGPAVVSTDPPAGDPCLLVVIRQDRFEEDRFLLDLTLFTGGQPKPCGHSAGSLEEIRELLRGRVAETFFATHGLPLIEFAVDDDLLGANFDQWPVPGHPGDDPDDDYLLGERFPVVVRDLHRMKPDSISAMDRDRWESRWQALLACDGPVAGLLREVDLQAMTSLKAKAIYKSLRAAFQLNDALGSAVLVLLPPASGKSATPGLTAIPQALNFFPAPSTDPGRPVPVGDLASAVPRGDGTDAVRGAGGATRPLRGKPRRHGLGTAGAGLERHRRPGRIDGTGRVADRAGGRDRRHHRRPAAARGHWTGLPGG